MLRFNLAMVLRMSAGWFDSCALTPAPSQGERALVLSGLRFQDVGLQIRSVGGGYPRNGGALTWPTVSVIQVCIFIASASRITFHPIQATNWLLLPLGEGVNSIWITVMFHAHAGA